MRKKLKDKSRDSSKEDKSLIISYPHETRIYSFTPKTNKNSKRSQTPRWKHLYEDSIRKNEKRDRSYIRKIMKNNRKTMKQCTFSPNIKK